MRPLLIKLHLYIAAFFAPVLLIMAVSGGLYLIGIKGQVSTTPVTVTDPMTIDTKAEDLAAEVGQFLVANGVDHDFEYIKVSGDHLITRPTSTTWYDVDVSGDVPTISRAEPDLVKRLVELHKGHGPMLFKDLQKVMAVGLMIVLLSGLWLGLSSPTLRVPTAITAGTGLLVFIVLALV